MKRHKQICRYPLKPLPAGLGALPPLLARVYANRGIAEAQDCEHGLARLAQPALLTGIGAAATLLAGAVMQRQSILIVGDFDADGATSSALAVRALRAMGACDVGYLVPNRFKYGYGLTPEIVAVAAERKPDLIVTVDNGISSLAGVTVARQAGIRVLVTDHHLPGAALPCADAIVNPNLPDDAFPSKNLAGVGVIFYVLAATRQSLEEAGWFQSRGIAAPKLAQWLDLVALGTVADVVPLDHNNRVLVEHGLRRIRSGNCVAGITALLAVAGRDGRRTVATDLGFVVGPRLNAAGRLDDMSLGIECLLADDVGQARALAMQLDTLNRQRRDIEAQMQADALAALAAMPDVTSDARSGICLYDEGWHVGVIGILASRIKDRLHRPVIAFAPDGAGEVRGSARSIPGIHVRDVLDTVAARHPGLLSRFGGHAMAAGLSLPEQSFDTFQQAFDQAVADLMSRGGFEPLLMSDGDLSPAELNVDTAQLLRSSGPWGQGFPEPLFDGVFDVVSRRLIGERHLKLNVRHSEGGNPIEAMVFNFDEAMPEGRRLHLAYRLDVNDYGGLVNPQLIVEQLEATSISAG